MTARPIKQFSEETRLANIRRNHAALMEQRREEHANGQLSAAWSFRNLKVETERIAKENA